MSRLSLRAHAPADVDAMLQLHRRAFPGAARSREHWDWLYRDGASIAVAMTDDGRCLGMFAGTRKRVWLGGRDDLAMLGMDVAIDPELRRGLAAGRLLVRLGRLHAALARDCRFLFGFPQPQLLRAMARHVGYEVLRDVCFLVRTVRPPAAPTRIVVAGSDRAPANADAHWQRCREGLRMALVRDGEHWNRRFCEHPDRLYSLLDARDPANGELRGLAAIRAGGVHPEVVSIIDWLVPDEDLEAEAALLAAIDAAAAATGRSRVVCWFPPCAAQFLGFQQRHGFHVVGSPYQVAFLPLSNTLLRVPVSEQWYQTMADMDFF